MSPNETPPNTSPAQPGSKLVQGAFNKAIAAIEEGQMPADLKLMGALAELYRIARALQGIEEAQVALSQGRSIPQQLDIFEEAENKEESRAVLPESRL